MTQRERESLATSQPGADPSSLLFGDDDSESTGQWPVDGEYKLTRADRRRTAQAQRRRRSRRGLWFVLLAVLIVGAVIAVLVPKVVDYFSTPDYSGGGYGSVTVVVSSGDSAKDIGTKLHAKDVVKSVEAFTDAADDNSASQNIQPGTYKLKLHMSGTAALDALLAPNAASQGGNVLVPEGETALGVEKRLVALYGQDKAAEITKAMTQAEMIGVPSNYRTGGKYPTSLEGFLYPATYAFDPGKTPTEALTTMVQRFVSQDRYLKFAYAAKAVKLSPYQALIVASIAQSEAKYSKDMPFVVRTILNRIKVNKPLQFDSTSSYECKVAGTPADKCIYNQVQGPYNTYTHQGLPPTPIDNPGNEAMSAAVTPADNPPKHGGGSSSGGMYLWFVNKDAAGHLQFFTTEKAFEKARVKCVKNHWGCG